MTVVVSFLMLVDPAAVSGGLKLMVPPNVHVVRPAPVTLPANADVWNNATLPSGKANAASTSNPFFTRMFPLRLLVATEPHAMRPSCSSLVIRLFCPCDGRLGRDVEFCL